MCVCVANRTEPTGILRMELGFTRSIHQSPVRLDDHIEPTGMSRMSPKQEEPPRNLRVENKRDLQLPS